MPRSVMDRLRGTNEPERAPDIRMKGAIATLHIPGKAADPAGLTHRNALDVLCATHQGYYERTTEDNGATVKLLLHLPTGDVLVARGPTTAMAVTDLEKRVTAWQEAAR